jgi:hypothetical protein
MGLDRFTRRPAHPRHLDALEHAPRPDDCMVPSLVHRFGLRGRGRLGRLAAEFGFSVAEPALQLRNNGVNRGLATTLRSTSTKRCTASRAFSHVTVALRESPARLVIDGGRLVPEPGQDENMVRR